MYRNSIKTFVTIAVLLTGLLGCDEPLGPEAPCVELLKKGLLNPETFELHDVTPLATSNLDARYESAKKAVSNGQLLIKMSCFKPMSMKCINVVDRWKNPIAKYRSIVKNIDDLKAGGGDIDVYKLRTKAEGKLGNKITSFSMCAIGNGKVFITNLDE